MTSLARALGYILGTIFSLPGLFLIGVYIGVFICGLSIPTIIMLRYLGVI